MRPMEASLPQTVDAIAMNVLGRIGLVCLRTAAFTRSCVESSSSENGACTIGHREIFSRDACLSYHCTVNGSTYIACSVPVATLGLCGKTVKIVRASTKKSARKSHFFSLHRKNQRLRFGGFRQGRVELAGTH